MSVTSYHNPATRLRRPSERVLEILDNPDIGSVTKEDGEVIIDGQGRRLV